MAGSAELTEQLERLLGASYRIVRELGGGGMSRVFLADDTALDRQVVIKVLHPELAASVNAERFKREVQLSARLQHPHVVPVLTAGEVDGLPYYVMPFVKGESLRARLAAGPLPIPEAIGILGDVAKALAYAQSEGVVHRDIKPDNILLSGGAATVADFGIAKALSAARQRSAGEDTAGDEGTAALTTLGTSLGTPAYMAPEQIAGDPNVDHRADIYSLGCVAYEMLAGHAPFAGKSPQQVLAAHVIEAPPPLDQQRAGIPPALVTLVNRCLEKEPSARPQSASELVAQLETNATTVPIPSATTVPTRARSRVPTWAVFAGVLALGIVAIPAYRVLRGAPKATDSSIPLAIAPFEVLDPQLALWKEGMVDVLSRNLDGSGPVRTIPPSVAVKRWEGRADRTVAMEFGKRVGAELVVYGQLQPAGHDFVEAKAWVVDTRRNAPPTEIQIRDSSTRMDRVTDSLSLKVLAAIGRDRPIGPVRVASLGSGSLPAIKAFLQGSQYFRRTRWDSAITAFKEAVTLDSTFGIAFLHLSQAEGWAIGAGTAEVIAAERRAGELVRPGLSSHDSLLLTAVGQYAKAAQGPTPNGAAANAAFATMQAAAERYPNDAEAWYMLGDMRFHVDKRLTYREALGYFDRAIAGDSDFAPAYIHAIELAYRYGEPVGIRYANAYLRRDPRDFEGEGIRLAAEASDPRARPDEIKQLLDTLPPRVVRKAYTAVGRLPDSAETAVTILRTAVRRAPNPGAKANLSALLADQLALHGHVAEAWTLAAQTKAPVAGDLAGLGLVPADSAMKVFRPWLNERSQVFIIPTATLAVVGDTATLLGNAAVMDRAAQQDTARRAILQYIASSLRAYAALARRDTAAATRLFDALPDTVITWPIDLFMRARLIGRQDPRRALTLLERYMPNPGLLHAVRELERGRLAERVGDRERAVDAYSYVAAVWRNADAGPLRDGAKEAADALRRLDADGRLRAQLVPGAKTGS